jgi:hypothetical protein
MAEAGEPGQPRSLLCANANTPASTIESCRELALNFRQRTGGFAPLPRISPIESYRVANVLIAHALGRMLHELGLRHAQT